MPHRGFFVYTFHVLVGNYYLDDSGVSAYLEREFEGEKIYTQFVHKF